MKQRVQDKKSGTGISTGDSAEWRRQLDNAIIDTPGWAAGLGYYRGEQLRRITDEYPMRVTPYYLSLADRSDPDDPILRQCIPDIRELSDADRFDGDPFDEDGHMPVPGLIHRFPDRALVMTTTDCAVRCRHCTRKNVLPTTRRPDSSAFEKMLQYLRSTESVREVLISGGDPLLLETETLDWLLRELNLIPHVEVLRIGTRVPVVLPMRIDDELCDMLAGHRPLWLNTQFNHPNELTDVAVAACERLVGRGIPVSNQTVLLRGINDDEQTMRDLCNGLQRASIRPYYVFECDPIAGIQHFRTEPGVGARLSEQMRLTLGGLSLPRFVADVPGEGGKLPLSHSKSACNSSRRYLLSPA